YIYRSLFVDCSTKECWLSGGFGAKNQRPPHHLAGVLRVQTAVQMDERREVGPETTPPPCRRECICSWTPAALKTPTCNRGICERRRRDSLRCRRRAGRITSHRLRSR